MTDPSPKLLWQPSKPFRERSHLSHYREWLREHKGLQFADYHELWSWSVEDIKAFWESIWEYFEVKSYTPYTEVLSGDAMPAARWFSGATVNYAEHLCRNKPDEQTAIIFQSERHSLQRISWKELRSQVGSLQAFLRAQGLTAGDRVVAYLPNIPEATTAFLATCSIGAVWSSCSPDFGSSSVIDRFQQIEPKVLIAVDGYQYGGKSFDRREVVREITSHLPTLERIIFLPYLNPDATLEESERTISWSRVMEEYSGEPEFTPVPFSHPIWVLYSSGTTGKPKAITHSQGGILLEHYKYLAFHNDVHRGENFFWFSTTGWMMWNFVQAAFLMDATLVLYDGSPGYPGMEILWRLAEEAPIHHFGTGAPYLVACMRADLSPGKTFDLGPLRSIGSTGSPLPPEAFDWAYDSVKSDLWLCSMSGGTDICTAFVGGNPLLPVYEGEIQCRALGCALYAWDEMGNAVIGEVGEMVITKPMPSMPIYFWNDPEGKRYRESYFEMYPGIWRHGDWVEITERGSLIIYGRSDATLNRQGVRIGTAEIYNVLQKMPEIKDSLIVNLELKGGEHFMPLFVVMESGALLDDVLKGKIKKALRSEYSPRHVPDEIIEVQDIPYTISGKKLEAPVKKILMGMPVEKAANPDAMRNPESLDFFVGFR
ncbi:acetoacetate--CoA ligase [Flavilitoribacter nigricans]|uniref:Acetoacetate--CoA ligase n=1 Tax=Flavilitoribacter nigricans (strain ATCC 23147 / DSM 23189 / NBRC 102662 / NCIMB 1420 / SS-2) TaxID=1122177 RepID=A0A2D0NJ71_FLAN2|nr:acetoacetate--CoA ligase [Flavilitoribacter nigricans]PHN08488.1 acetoacetate--CoA ligase [Flavilitoribacter nigricans DSM 23189 = NBRC 102662]